MNGDVPKDPKSGEAYCYISDNGQSYRLFAKLENYPGQNDPGLIYPDQTQFQSPNIHFNYSKTSDDLNLAQAPGDPAPTPPIAVASPTPVSTAFKRVFVTDGAYSAKLGGLAGADAICQFDASIAELCGNLCPDGSWKTWLSDDSNSPSTRFNHSSDDVRYILVDYITLVAANWDDLTDGLLTNDILLSEDATPPSGIATVWTSH